MTQDPWPAPYARTPVRAVVALPGSKSLTNRELVLASIADRPSVVRRALRSRDTVLMAKALTAIGSHVDTSSADWMVIPGTFDREAKIDCGLAGTVMRFVPPVAALSSAKVSFDGDHRARTRPMAEVLDGLRQVGVRLEDRGTGTLPFDVLGTGSVRGGRVTIDASASSQFISALLLAAPRYDEGIDVVHDGKPVPSHPHIEMTVACLRARGVEVDDSDANRWHVLPGPVKAVSSTIEPDLSNAAPFLMLAMVSGGSVTVSDWPRSTTQPGDDLRDLLTRMGASVTLGDDGLTVTAGDAIHGLDADLHDVGELTPAIAALCALADSPSVLRGVAHIRGHETDRLAALARELGNLGADVTERPDGLEIRPATLHAGRFATYADHRMAHAGVILGAGVEGILVEDVATTAKTFPDFAKVWAGLFPR